MPSPVDGWRPCRLDDRRRDENGVRLLLTFIFWDTRTTVLACHASMTIEFPLLACQDPGG